MSTTKYYNIWCITENKFVGVWSSTVPTACPNNSGHAVNTSRVFFNESMSNVVPYTAGEPLPDNPVGGTSWYSPEEGLRYVYDSTRSLWLTDPFPIQFYSASSRGACLDCNGTYGFQLNKPGIVRGIRMQGVYTYGSTLPCEIRNSGTLLHSFSLTEGFYSSSSLSVLLSANTFLQIYVDRGLGKIMNPLATVDLSYRLIV